VIAGCAVTGYAVLRAGRAGGALRARPAALAALLAAGGLMLAAAPQMAINQRHFHRSSPFAVNAHDLGFVQLEAGVRAQKYETSVDPTTGATRPKLWFIDPPTIDALRGDGLAAVPRSYSGYLRIVLRHPVVFAGAYLRRTFNGLDVQYASPYVRHQAGDRSPPRSLLLYTVLFLSGLVVLAPPLRRRLGGVRPLLLALLLPVLPAIPGAVEPRFFLPATCLAFALVCFGLDPGQAWRDLAGRRALVAAAGVVFVVACFAIAHHTYSLLRYDYPVLAAPGG
jgi:hypothetical protein